MGQAFPFEVGKVVKSELSKYGIFTQIQGNDIHPMVQLYVETEIISELPDPCILDYIENEHVSLSFIPIIPLPFDQYQFYNANSK